MRPEVHAAGLQELQGLSEKSPRRLAILRLMLGDATARGESPRAYALAKTLASDPQATFQDKLIRLATLRAARNSEFRLVLRAPVGQGILRGIGADAGIGGRPAGRVGPTDELAE